MEEKSLGEYAKVQTAEIWSKTLITVIIGVSK